MEWFQNLIILIWVIPKFDNSHLEWFQNLMFSFDKEFRLNSLLDVQIWIWYLGVALKFDGIRWLRIIKKYQSHNPNIAFNSKKFFKTGFFLEFNSKKLFKTGFFLGFNSKKYSFNTKKGVPPTPTPISVSKWRLVQMGIVQ